ncbi:MAG: MMPL family transporter [Bacteroidales bacterium]|nr:MMPL family transporter [Bacteroidales bacterium]
MTELCIRIYRYFKEHRAFYWSLMLLLFGFFGYFAAQIHLEEDIAKLLPSSKNEDGSTKLAFADLRIKDKTFLLFEANPSLSEEERIDTLAAVCDRFVADMQQRLAQMEAKGDTVIQNIFSTISKEDVLFDAVDFMSQQLPCYIDTSAYASFDTLFTEEHMLRQMAINREQGMSPIGQLFPELIAMDPLGLRGVLMEQMQGMVGGLGGSYQIIDGHFFVPDSSVCLTFLTPSFSATNTGQGAKFFTMLNKMVDEYAASTPQVKVCYHGSTARGAYNAWQTKADLRNTITGSLIVVLIFIFFCFRNWNTIPLLLLPVGFGTVFGLAMMYFIKGQFSLLALGIGAIVLGVALSYVLHVITHYKYLSDPEQVLRDQVQPVFLGCLTTIGSFMGLIFINTELLQDFGLFASFAVVGTTIFSLVFLPQFFNPKKNRRNRRAFALIDKINVYPFDRKPWLLGIIGLFTAVCLFAYFKGGVDFDADMRNLGYLSENVTYSEELLRAKTHTGDKQQYFASSGQTMEEALENFSLMAEKLDSLQAEGLVKSYTPTSTIFVPEKVQQERIEAWQNYWSEERLNLVHKLVDKTAPKVDIAPDYFAPFFEAATASYDPEPLYEQGIIPEGLQTTMMEQSKDGSFLCFTSVRCNNDVVRSDSSDYQRICRAIASEPNLMVLDTYFYTQDTLLELNGDFNVLQWISMAFVFVVLLLSFRFNLKHTLLGFFPIIVSWLIVLGTMVIFERQFNLINIIISTFIFGIGVDYSIFVMSGLLASKHNPEPEVNGEPGRDALLLSYHKTAILFSAVVLIVTVASMLFAEHPAIKGVGFATLWGMVSAVVLSYVVQPFLFRLLNKKK